MQATLSLSEDLQNNSSANLFTEAVRFNKKLLRRNDLIEASKY